MPIDTVNVGKNAVDVQKGVKFEPYTRVIINVSKTNSEEIVSYVAGDASGNVLEFDCPWGTQEMANDLLEKINGFRYQPYTVTDAIIDPAAEIGDGVSVNGIYSSICSQDAIFSHTFYSDISAPQDEQLDHEFTYETPVERRLRRQEAYSKATFRIQHDNIEACVAKKSGYIQEETFSWRLLSNQFGLYSGTKQVFKCDKDGILVDGKIQAREGFFGKGDITDGTFNGFYIGEKSIYNTKTGIGLPSDNITDGVYIGKDGFALGSVSYTVDNVTTKYDAFSVTRSGEFTARKGYIGDYTNGFSINAKNIHNGTASLTDTTQGVYLGTDGIRVYNSSTASFTFKKDGTIEIKKGMTGIDDESNTSGFYFGNDGLVLGGGKLKLAKDGSFTSKTGNIAGWDINTHRLISNHSETHDDITTKYYTAVVNGNYAFVAGCTSDDSDDYKNANFSVKTNGQVKLTKLYYQSLDTEAEGYDPEKPKTWTYIWKEFDFDKAIWKIEGNNQTIKSISGGTVTLSNGRTFNSAASVYVKGAWSSNTWTASPYIKVKNGSTEEEKAAGGASASTAITWEWVNSANPYKTDKCRFQIKGTNPSTAIDTSSDIYATSTISSDGKYYDISVKCSSHTVCTAQTDTTAYSNGASSVTISDFGLSYQGDATWPYRYYVTYKKGGTPQTSSNYVYASEAYNEGKNSVSSAISWKTSSATVDESTSTYSNDVIASTSGRAHDGVKEHTTKNTITLNTGTWGGTNNTDRTILVKNTSNSGASLLKATITRTRYTNCANGLTRDNNGKKRKLYYYDEEDSKYYAVGGNKERFWFYKDSAQELTTYYN